MIEDAVSWLNKLKLNFTNVNENFIQLAIELAIEEGFSNERFKHACKALLLAHPYPTIQIANLLNYDAKIRLYTHEEKLKRWNEDKIPFEMYISYGNQPNGKPFWAMKSDLKKYGII